MVIVCSEVGDLLLAPNLILNIALGKVGGADLHIPAWFGNDTGGYQLVFMPKSVSRTNRVSPKAHYERLA
jgi:hypothetical protein